LRDNGVEEERSDGPSLFLISMGVRVLMEHKKGRQGGVSLIAVIV